MAKHRSLLIIGLPRSGSTEFERVCTEMLAPLKFKSRGEFLNKAFKKSNRAGAKFGHYSKKFEQIKRLCLKWPHNHVLRDVVQTKFVVAEIDWLLEHFNIIYLIRPADEAKLCANIIGWRVATVKLTEQLEIIKDQVVTFDYYDFVLGPPKKLLRILQQWYPDCQKVNYLTRDFVLKRKSVFRKLRQHGIKPRRIA